MWLHTIKMLRASPIAKNVLVQSISSVKVENPCSRDIFLKLELTEFADGLDVDVRKRRVKDFV